MWLILIIYGFIWLTLDDECFFEKSWVYDVFADIMYSLMFHFYDCINVILVACLSQHSLWNIGNSACFHYFWRCFFLFFYFALLNSYQVLISIIQQPITFKWIIFFQQWFPDSGSYEWNSILRNLVSFCLWRLCLHLLRNYKMF